MTHYVHISAMRISEREMNYLGDKVFGNFKQPKTPNRTKKIRARDRRPGMDPEHVKNVAKLSSCISGLKPCDPHHLKKKDERGVSLKATDQWCVPLTRTEHNEIERLGARREVAWFAQRGIDPYSLAAGLWFNRGDLDAMQRVVEAHRAARNTD